MRKDNRIERRMLVDLLNHIQFLSEMTDEEPRSIGASDDVADEPLRDVPDNHCVSAGEDERRTLEADREPSCD